MLKIVSVKTETPALKRFEKKEWPAVDFEHYGRHLPPSYTKDRDFRFVAKAGKEILGVLTGDYLLGVMYVASVMVTQKARGQGVGEKLMRYAERYARQRNLHLIHLETGVDWKAAKFYRQLGYKVVYRFKKFYGKKTFLIFAKYL